MTNKLQAMMQTHCNEALRLLQIGSLTAGDTNVQNTSKQVLVFKFYSSLYSYSRKIHSHFKE